MNRIKKMQILQECCNPSAFTIDKLDQFVQQGDITIEEFANYHLEISKVEELKRRKAQREGITLPTEEPAPQTQSSIFDAEPQKSIWDTESKGSIWDTDPNASIFGTPVTPPPSAPVAATPVAPTYQRTTADKSIEIQKVLAQQVGIQDIIDRINQRLYTYDDLEAAGVPKRIVTSFKHYQNQNITKFYNVEDLPPMDKGRTDVFFVGIPASGKSVMLSGLLYYTKKMGISIPDSYNIEGEKYSAQITSYLEKGVLPKPTGSGTYNYIAISLKDDKKKAHPLNIVEVPGENYAKIFDGGLENEEVRGFVNYVKNSNRKILIFVLDALEHQQRLEADYANMYSQSDIYVSILNMFKTYKILDKTDAIYIVVNKFDVIKKSYGQNSKTNLDLADEFVREEFRNLLNNCIDAKENSGNKFKIKVFPFSIGEVCYDKILKEYNQEYSRNIVEQVLSDSFIVGGGKGIFGGLFG